MTEAEEKLEQMREKNRLRQKRFYEKNKALITQKKRDKYNLDKGYILNYPLILPIIIHLIIHMIIMRKKKKK